MVFVRRSSALESEENDLVPATERIESRAVRKKKRTRASRTFTSDGNTMMPPPPPPRTSSNTPPPLVSTSPSPTQSLSGDTSDEDVNDTDGSVIGSEDYCNPFEIDVGGAPSTTAAVASAIVGDEDDVDPVPTFADLSIRGPETSGVDDEEGDEISVAGVGEVLDCPVDPNQKVSCAFCAHVETHFDRFSLDVAHWTAGLDGSA